MSRHAFLSSINRCGAGIATQIVMLKQGRVTSFGGVKVLT